MHDLGVAFTALVVFVLLTSLILFSSNIHTQQVESENAIVEARQEFLDTVSDKGAVTWSDYKKLMTRLNSTGGTFEVSVTVKRMFAIPDSSPLSPQNGSTTNGFVNDYRPIYGISARDGSWERLNQDYNAATGDGPIFMRRHDLITLTIKQTAFMPYQTNMLRQLNLTPGLREWTLARGVRNSGNHMVENEDPPIEWD